MKRSANGLYYMTVMYAVAFNIAIALAVVVLHEAGHFAAGTALGCSNLQIVLLDHSLSTFTQMNCPPMQAWQSQSLMLAGSLFVVPFAALLFVLRGHERYYSLVAMGFNAMISSSDFAFLGTAAYALTALGAMLLVFGEFRVTSSYMDALDKTLFPRKNRII